MDQTQAAGADRFEEHQAAWGDYLGTPWARLRYSIVEHTLARVMSDLGPGPHRVLDVGGGDGGDATPLARLGHRVTVLDPSGSMLETAAATAAREGLELHVVRGGLDDLAEAAWMASYDVVLCHYVLHYRDVPLEDDLTRLMGASRPGGLVSLLMPNPAGVVLARLVRQGPEAALAELDSNSLRSETFDAEVRKIDADEVERAMTALGANVVGRFGGRIANDLVLDNDVKHDPSYFATLERLEKALCDREPFLRIGAFWQRVFRAP